MKKSKEEIEGLGNLYLINETREWVKDDIPEVYTQDDINKAVAWGYDEGFYDATKWHYPSKGELPTENGKYLVDWRGEYGEHIDIDQWSDGKWLYMGEVVAWQYIVPPKEEA